MGCGHRAGAVKLEGLRVEDEGLGWVGKGFGAEPPPPLPPPGLIRRRDQPESTPSLPPGVKPLATSTKSCLSVSVFTLIPKAVTRSACAPPFFPCHQPP